MQAATRYVVKRGLSAPAASIVKEAGVANGSLSPYFGTKTDRFNQLYLELKTEMASAALAGLRHAEAVRAEYFRVWQSWTSWAVSHPEKRRALAQLTVFDELTPETRPEGHKTMAPIVGILQRILANVPMSRAPMGLVVALRNAAAEATIDAMTHDPPMLRKTAKLASMRSGAS